MTQSHGATGGDTGAVRVEGDAADHGTVLEECVHAVLRVQVPELDRLVVTPRDDQPVVGRDGAVSHPVDVAAQGKREKERERDTEREKRERR